jgi:hypothetical protein
MARFHVWCDECEFRSTYVLERDAEFSADSHRQVTGHHVYSYELRHAHVNKTKLLT